MIVASCPLRISLVGGSTDHPSFLEKYGEGSVISFASNLRTYVSIHQDAFGMNSIEQKYSINYSKKECVSNIKDIKNELIRNCFEYLNVQEINCALTSDIYSVGSGLAASSSYLMSLIKAIFTMRNEFITEFEVCKIAEVVEKKFNPLVGQQDFYGSLGGLKIINFYKDKNPYVSFLDTSIFKKMNCYLLYTGVLRNSTSILETIDIDKSYNLIKNVKDLQLAIETYDVVLFNEIMKEAWNNKKQTSKYICQNEKLISLDNLLENDTDILSHKLCGAGNGGYFLIFSKKGVDLKKKYKYIKEIDISESGIKVVNLSYEFRRL